MWKEVVTFLSFGKFMGGFFFHGWGGDGREEQLLEYVLKNAERGNPQSVIQAVDEFARSGTWFMNVGEEKGRILDSSIAKKNPQLLLELGTYCGYSAVRMAANLKHPDSKLISLELTPHIADIARRIIDHAGLSSKVEVLLAPLSRQIDTIKSTLAKTNGQCFDFVFVDHDKDLYLPDYLLLKEKGLIDEGSVIFADNMGFPGSPKFWSYIQSHPQELETEVHKSAVEYISWIRDTVTVSTFHKL
ncbi:hypothetical protein SELMODRAFT_450883 [Selaginella moellendorffii]|uniref:catechol O-methyltransferase n=1 Tax=Selaginella moellendorffii TaxID=88036 RepID=D8TCJ8_SELML|nr:catechol O-methyltransferase [Selaginella moellendorffii]EFJ05621.1 hypothetical protein SELMODRAFT_450883 [Selaginella moellendorffii]|eukprot:XP_002993296.1 catechol O-methyltransferase [Selaginella moellendorffii]